MSERETSRATHSDDREVDRVLGLGEFLRADVNEPVNSKRKELLGLNSHELFPKRSNGGGKRRIIGVRKSEIEDSSDDPTRRMRDNSSIVSCPRRDHLEHQSHIFTVDKSLVEFDRLHQHIVGVGLVLFSNCCAVSLGHRRVHLSICVRCCWDEVLRVDVAQVLQSHRVLR